MDGLETEVAYMRVQATPSPAVDLIAKIVGLIGPSLTREFNCAAFVDAEDGEIEFVISPVGQPSRFSLLSVPSNNSVEAYMVTINGSDDKTITFEPDEEPDVKPILDWLLPKMAAV